MVAHQRLVQFVPDPLCRYACKRRGQSLHRLEGAPVDVEVETGCEAACAQHAQGVLRESLIGVAYGTDQAPVQVASAVVVVDDGAVESVRGECVDREVPPLEIALQRPDERDAVGMARVGIAAFASEGGHLIALSSETDGHRSVLEPGGYDMVGEHGHDLVRSCIRGEVIIVVRYAHQVVAHRPAYQVEPVAVVGEYPSERLRVPIQCAFRLHNCRR